MCRLTSPDRELYKTRLEVFFKHYPSKNFDGRSWSELSEIVLVRRPFRSVSKKAILTSCTRASISKTSHSVASGPFLLANHGSVTLQTISSSLSVSTMPILPSLVVESLELRL